MQARSSIQSLWARTALCICAAAGASAALAQGVLKPVEALVVNTAARPLPVTVVGSARASHLGASVEDHVTLIAKSDQGGPCAAAKGLFRILPDGTVASTAFVIPAGRSLVVLDFDAVVRIRDLEGPFNVGSSVVATLVTPNNLFTLVDKPFTSGGALISVPGVTTIAVNGASSAGTVFGPGQQVCMHGEARLVNGSSSPSIIANGAVRGYLF